MVKIEDEIFSRCKMDFEALQAYGFVEKEDTYVYSTDIVHGAFNMQVVITLDGHVEAKVYDTSFHEEYINFRIVSNAGEFVTRVKEEYIKVLEDIKKHCCKATYFVTEQANRIADAIMQKYQDTPEFMWKTSPGHGVFRNVNNRKWYALIMYININKIAQGDAFVEIINVKLEEEKIQNLLMQEGFYPAYHMNKKSWISILLDDTLEDEEVLTYIDESYTLIDK